MMLCLLSVSVFIYSSDQQDMKDKEIVINGDFILTDDNYKKAKSIKIIKGGLGIETNNINKVKLNTESIGGLLAIGDKVKEIYLPKLKEVSSIYLTPFKSETKLEKIELPLLEKVHEDIYINRNSNLKEINFPELKEIQSSDGNGITIKYNDNLQEVNLPKLEKVAGDIDITCNYLLKKIIFSNLKRIEGKIFIGFNTEINILDFKKIDFANERITIADTSLKEIDLKSLTNVKALSIYNNDYLKKIKLNNLTKIGKFISLQDNNMLKRVFMPKIDSVGEFNGSSMIFENNGVKSLRLKVEKIPEYKGEVEGIEFEVLKVREN